MKLARGFLYIIAFLTFLVIAAFFLLRIYSEELSEFAFVPTTPFEEQEPLAANAYAAPEMWFSYPPFYQGDPARWWPEIESEADEGQTSPADPAGNSPPFNVFFIHPTSYLEKEHWNASLDDETSQERARLFLKGMASPFNGAGEIWAPRYRQAAFGAFLTDEPQADEALDAAYRDVEQAFEEFLSKTDPEVPVILAGHSQGALHLLRLLRSRIKGTPVQNRIAAAYAIGWPISLDHDLPALGMPACSGPDQQGCVISWLSFADPAEPGQMLKRFEESPGFDGEPRKGSAILCSNPLTGGMGGSAPESANLGTLVPNLDMTSGELVPGAVPATCREDGILIVGEPPELGPAVLPGNNYHVYDIPLFWANLKQDVGRRAQAWIAAQ